jgi:alanine dehydrogenase
MNIGTLKEIKDNENRVGLTPAGCAKLKKAGHRAYVQRGAGEGTGYTDREYRRAGAIMVERPADLVGKVEILVKVKEPLPSEYPLLDRFKGKTLFTYLHLAAADRRLTLNLMKNRITGIAYATVEDRKGNLPLLKPMSEVAGALSVQYASEFLQKKYGGRGVTLGHIPNVEPVQVVIIGGGAVGNTAAKTAAGMGARVTLFDIDDNKVAELRAEMADFFGKNLVRNVKVLRSTPSRVSAAVKKADAVIGAVLVKGARTPMVVTRSMVRSMKRGSVIVDVAIDQGGCVWGSRPTTHSDPVYTLEDVIFCCVANMPGQASLQATDALTHATFPYLLKMANLGVLPYIRKDRFFARGVNVHDGKIVYRAVAESLDLLQHYEPLKR